MKEGIEMAEESSTAKVPKLSDDAQRFLERTPLGSELSKYFASVLALVAEQAQAIQQHEARIASLRELVTDWANQALRLGPHDHDAVVVMHQCADELLARLDAK